MRKILRLPSVGYLSTEASFTDFSSMDGHHRIDTGIDGGDRITPFYDPMIAKIIGYGANRDTAIDECEVGITTSNIGGIASNDQFLVNCLFHPDFENGHVSTGFIETHSAILIWPNLIHLDETYALAGAQYFSAEQDNPVSFFKPSRNDSSPTPFDDYEGWRTNLENVKKVWFARGQETVEVEYIKSDKDSITLLVNGQPITVLDSKSDGSNLDLPTLLKHRGSWSFEIDNEGIARHRLGRRPSRRDGSHENGTDSHRPA